MLEVGGGGQGALCCPPPSLLTPPPPPSSASTQEHLKRVYGSFALCMLLAALGAYVNVATQLFQVWGGLGLLGPPVSLRPPPRIPGTPPIPH